MSSDRPSAGPLRAAEARPGKKPGPALPAEAARVRVRGFALIDALDRHAPGAAQHAKATGDYAFAASVALGGKREWAELVREAAKLHEVGRVYVPAEVLGTPPEALTDEGRAQLDGHHEAGAALARGAGVPEEVCAWIESARERFDGKGPRGLGGEDIPPESRIIRAACACDRLLAWHGARPRAERVEATVAALREGAGRELDPRVVEALAGIVEAASGGGAGGRTG